MVGHYAADEGVNTVGFTLTRVSGDSDIWEVYRETDENHQYIDTIDVSQFATATQLVNQLASYYPDDEGAEDVEPREETEDAVLGRSYQ